MENINIKINKSTRKVNLEKSVIGNDGENLQENLVFEFDDFVDGTARLELQRGNDKSYLMLEKVDETYQIPVKSVITKGGRLNLQLVITEGTDDEEIPIFKSNQFYVIVNSSINAETIQEEDYPTFIDRAETKLNAMDIALGEVDNLDITATKEDKTATITIIKKDGTQTSENIYDGEDGTDGQDGITPTIGDNGNWYIGEIDTGKPSRGERGPAGTTDYNDLINKPDLSNYITKEVDDLTNYYKKTETYTQTEIDTKLTAVYKYKGTVSTYADLPSTGLTRGDVYNVESDGSNYAWTGSEWDKLGGTVDLSDYYTKQQTYSQAEVNTLLSGKLDSSKVKNASSTTAGDVYDVRYINSLIGDIASALDLINGESVGA